MSKCEVPYDNIYVFHDAENCNLPAKLEARDGNNKKIFLPNGQLKFLESTEYPAGVGSIQGAYVFKEIVRTGIACRIGIENAKRVNIVGLDINMSYHFVMSAKSVGTPYYPSESTLKDFVDIVGGNFHRHVQSDRKENPSWTDQKIKELWEDQAKQCKKNFTPEAIERTLFILVSGDRDFAPEIRQAVKTGVDVNIIYSMDAPIRASIFEILKSPHWAIGNWLDIVSESRKRFGSTFPVLSSPYPTFASLLVPGPNTTTNTSSKIKSNSAFSFDDAITLYEFIVSKSAKASDSINRMLAADIQYFYKAHPEVKARTGAIKIKEFCRTFPDLFEVQHDGKAGIDYSIELLFDLLIEISLGIDWIYCTATKGQGFHQLANSGGPNLLDDAKLLYTFIKDKAATSSDPTERILAAEIHLFYKICPDFKERIGTMKVKEFCKLFPAFFEVQNDGKAGKILYEYDLKRERIVTH